MQIHLRTIGRYPSPERQRAGLGTAFVARVDATLDAHSDGPLVFPKHPADVRVRRALVARFPYAVVFALLGEAFDERGAGEKERSLSKRERRTVNLG